MPLETFAPAVERLLTYSDHLAVLGLSKGAEAALLVAAADPRVRVVVALSPTSVVWANVGPGYDGRTRPHRSSWTRAGVPLPFVPYDDTWQPEEPGYRRGLYEQSLVAFADRLPAATIPVERFDGRLLVTGGGRDRIWPTEWFARDIAARRTCHGLETIVVTSSEAGHRVLLRGEVAAAEDNQTAEADADLGRRVWPLLADLLRLA